MPKSLQDQSEFNTSKIRNLKNIFFFATILAVYVRVWMSVSVWGCGKVMCHAYKNGARLPVLSTLLRLTAKWLWLIMKAEPKERHTYILYISAENKENHAMRLGLVVAVGEWALSRWYWQLCGRAAQQIKNLDARQNVFPLKIWKIAQ